jgi:hypothetical protein
MIGYGAINTPDPETFAGYAATIDIRADAIWRQCMNRTELGDRACVLRHFNFSTGGGVKLKWPAKIATLVSATAITIASGFGAPAAVDNKELNPTADIQKYSFEHRAKLRWLFDEDPGSLKIELGSEHYVTKIMPTDRLESPSDILGRLIPGRVKARVIKGPICQLDEGDVAYMNFDLPSDFDGWRQDLQNLYDITNILNMEIGREYYVIASCASYGPRLAYIIE